MNEQHIQEAYNKGLDFAENQAVVKLNEALNGEDFGRFANPKMEELKQKLLSLPILQTEPTHCPPSCHSTPNWVLESILNGEGLKTHVNSENQCLLALNQLMNFIYEKAARGNNGAKNYIQMVNDIKTALTNDEPLV